jgi:hypothetical protein
MADAKKIVAAYLASLKDVEGLRYLEESHSARRELKTAGEVRHVKDTGGDASTWAYAVHSPSERELNVKFEWNPAMVESLALVLRSTVAAMGHAINAQNVFAQIESRNVSPDGRLGGKGYVQRVVDMRRQYFNIVEALSSLQDTLFDEVHAAHWTAIKGESAETQEVLEQTDEIRDNPGSWAEDALETDAEAEEISE